MRFQIDCQIFNLFPFSILIERYRDGEQMKWDNLENDYIAPIISTKISKMMKSVTSHYDTFEVIGVGQETAVPFGRHTSPPPSATSKKVMPYGVVVM